MWGVEDGNVFDALRYPGFSKVLLRCYCGVSNAKLPHPKGTLQNVFCCPGAMQLKFAKLFFCYSCTTVRWTGLPFINLFLENGEVQ